MTVLIADNDRAVSGLLTEVLKHSGLQMQHAFDGDKARELARGPSVRVLVCDLDMPGASGLEVLESLRDLPEPPRSIVISGYLDAAIEARLRAMPFVREVLRKPFDLLVFAAIVRRLAAAAGAAVGTVPENVQPGCGTEPPAQVRIEARGDVPSDVPSDLPSDPRSDTGRDGSGDPGVAVEH